MTKKQTIEKNSPIELIITANTAALISIIWLLVMVKFWPFNPIIGWALFAIPVTVTVLVPLMLVIRKIQARKNK